MQYLYIYMCCIKEYYIAIIIYIENAKLKKIKLKLSNHIENC